MTNMLNTGVGCLAYEVACCDSWRDGHAIAMASYQREKKREGVKAPNLQSAI